MHVSRLVLLLAVFLTASGHGVAIAEPYRHAASGFECPDDVAGFKRTGVDDYEAEQPSLGVGCKYQLQRDLFADVYIFTAGLQTVPPDITHPVMSRLREQTLSEIARFAESRNEQARRVNEATLVVETDRGPVSVFYDSFVISSPNGTRNTWLWLWPARNHVMKIRMTRPPSGHVDPKKVLEFYQSVVRLAAD